MVSLDLTGKFVLLWRKLCERRARTNFVIIWETLLRPQTSNSTQIALACVLLKKLFSGNRQEGKEASVLYWCIHSRTKNQICQPRVIFGHLTQIYAAWRWFMGLAIAKLGSLASTPGGQVECLRAYLLHFLFSFAYFKLCRMCLAAENQTGRTCLRSQCLFRWVFSKFWVAIVLWLHCKNLACLFASIVQMCFNMLIAVRTQLGHFKLHARNWSVWSVAERKEMFFKRHLLLVKLALSSSYSNYYSITNKAR